MSYSIADHYDSHEPWPNEKRYLLVRGARSEEQLAAYLPSNYKVVGGPTATDKPEFLVGGHDNAGFTLEYVRDRLASGLIWGREADAHGVIIEAHAA